MLTSCSPLLLLPCSMLFVFELWLLSSPSHNCHGSISISRSSTSSSPELYHGSPASTRSTPVIHRRRPALLMIHYDDLCFMEQDCTGSSTMIETRSDLLPWLSPSPRNGWHQINSHVLCFPTSSTTCPSTSQWFGTFNLTLISWTFVTQIWPERQWAWILSIPSLGSSNTSSWMVSKTKWWYLFKRLHSALFYARDIPPTRSQCHIASTWVLHWLTMPFALQVFCFNSSYPVHAVVMTNSFLFCDRNFCFWIEMFFRPPFSSSLVLLQFWLSLLIMTKRDSAVANLPSPRDLRRPSHGFCTWPGCSYGIDFRVLCYGNPASYAIFRRHFVLSTSTLRNPLGTPTQGIPSKNIPHFHFQNLWVRPESSWTCGRRTWWHGIHEDQNPWDILPWHRRSCSGSAWSTYWQMGSSSHFGQLLATILQHDRKHVAISWLWQLQQDNLPQLTDPSAAGPDQLQVPHSITQLSPLLHGILLQDPDGNASILKALNAASSSSSSATLNHDGLAFLAGHLAILSNYLPRRGAVNTELWGLRFAGW